MPDWAKLTSYADKKWRSFEELCYQIAFRLHSADGQLSRIDDSGGGDGVEFYLRRPDGTEWGWQAKYYLPGERLKDSNRKQKITSSFQRSLEKHPKTTKWILCTPMIFTGDEIAWFDSALPELSKEIELDRWDESRIDAFVNLPAMAGIKLNFFGELEFNPDWFRRQVEGQLHRVKDKFNPQLHTSGSADARSHALLGDKHFLKAVDVGVQQAKSFDETLRRAVKVACSHQFDTHLLKGPESQSIRSDLEGFAANASIAMAILEQFRDSLGSGDFEAIGPGKLNGPLQKMDEARERIGERLKAILEEGSKAISKLPETPQKEEKRKLDSIQRLLTEPFDSGSDLVAQIQEVLSSYTACSRHVLHFFGEAGSGKTHLASALCAERLSEGQPTVLLLGSDFHSYATLKSRIRELCDIPSNYSFDDFLAALDSYAFARRTKALIAIDALNEAQSPQTWASHLPDFESRIEDTKRVSLITTCRTSYVEPIWGAEFPTSSSYVTGFSSENIDEATQRYFEYYKIRASVTVASLAQFANPLYLKIFCESQNPLRTEEKSVHVGEQSFLEVFAEYIRLVDVRISEKLGKPPGVNLLVSRLRDFAIRLWTDKARSLPRPTVIQLLDRISAENMTEWANSVTKHLEDENLLITRNWSRARGGEEISFTYDFLGGFLIGNALSEGKSQTEIKGLMETDQFKDQLLDADYGKLHPLWEDILRCFAVLLPHRAGLYLHEILQSPRALGFGVRALFEMDAHTVRGEDQRTVEELFGIAKNRLLLLKYALGTAFNYQHPLNWKFWDGILGKLSLAERDSSWTEFVRANSHEILGVIDKVESRLRLAETASSAERERLYLAGDFLSWLLTSTNRLLRDSATRALYWLGRCFPERLFAQTLRSLKTNDPYVPERMLAACYGVTMAFYRSHGDEDFGKRTLPEFAMKLYRAMFASKARFATTHALMRDFVRHVLDLAVLLHPKLFSTRARRRFTPPYREGGIRRLKVGKDRNPKEYRDGNFPLGMDFHNYTLGRLVRKRNNYDFKHPGFQKVVAHVWWRIYDLGYSLETFGEIDTQIVRAHWRVSRSEDNASRIDRYGKKYAWIAFYELYGLFQDKGLLQDDWVDADGRTSDVDIEPSFPHPPNSISIVNECFLGPSNITAHEWIEHPDTPDLRPYLLLSELDGEAGPWILLYGGVDQENKDLERRIAISTKALLVRRGVAARLEKAVKASIEDGYRLPRTSDRHYTFVGEMPWCETIPLNGMNELELLMKKIVRKETKEEVRQRMQAARISVAIDKYFGLGGAAKRRTRTSDVTAAKPRRIEAPVYQKFDVLLPVRHMAWESYHTATTEHQGTTIAKDIARALDLWVNLPSMDMKDSVSRRAVICTSFGDPWRSGESFVYVRKDLLDRYLAESSLECIWGIWGEKDFSVEFINSRRIEELPGRRWNAFKNAHIYPIGQ